MSGGKLAFFPGTTPCEICGETVGDRVLEGLWCCGTCIEALATPARASVPVLEEHRGPSLEQVVDSLLARPVL